MLVERREHTLLVTLNRPDQRNAVTGAMATEIGSWLDRAADDDDIRAVVVTGAGDRAFCAGGDLEVIRRGESIHSPTRPDWGFAGMRRHFVSKPLVAAVNGMAVGGGFEICLACDVVVAADTAWFSLPEGRHGFAGNPGGAYRLARQLPQKLALELVLTGNRITADEALRHGLVNRVTAAGDVVAEALKVAADIAACAPLSLAASKRIAHGVVDGESADERAVWAEWAARLGSVD